MIYEKRDTAETLGTPEQVQAKKSGFVWKSQPSSGDVKGKGNERGRRGLDFGASVKAVAVDRHTGRPPAY